MDIKTKRRIGLVLTTLLTVSLTAPSLVHAGKGDHHHRHYNRHHDHHRHANRSLHIYNKPPVYYQQRYPQAQYNYNYNYYPPASVYVVPPRVNMGINTGNMDFMLRF